MVSLNCFDAGTLSTSDIAFDVKYLKWYNQVRNLIIPFLFCQGGEHMPQELIYFGITTAITIALGIISYFLKRTIDRSDRLEETVQELRESQFTLSDKYATKAEVAEIKAAMQKLSDNIDYIKEHTTKNEDFIRVMTRLESKIDNYCNR